MLREILRAASMGKDMHGSLGEAQCQSWQRMKELSLINLSIYRANHRHPWKKILSPVFSKDCFLRSLGELVTNATSGPF